MNTARLDGLPVDTLIEVDTDGGTFRLRKVDADHWALLPDDVTLHTEDVTGAKPTRVEVLYGEDPAW